MRTPIVRRPTLPLASSQIRTAYRACRSHYPTAIMVQTPQHPQVASCSTLTQAMPRSLTPWLDNDYFQMHVTTFGGLFFDLFTRTKDEAVPPILLAVDVFSGCATLNGTIDFVYDTLPWVCRDLMMAIGKFCILRGIATSRANNRLRAATFKKEMGRQVRLKE